MSEREDSRDPLYGLVFPVLCCEFFGGGLESVFKRGLSLEGGYVFSWLVRPSGVYSRLSTWGFAIISLLGVFSAVFGIFSCSNLFLTCSAKKCDNSLVEANILYHFRGIILCNAKRLHFSC